MLLPHSDELNVTKFPYLLRNYQATLNEDSLLHSRTESCETCRLYVLCTSWMKRMHSVKIISDSQPAFCVFFFRNNRKISMKSNKVTSVLNLLSELNFGLFRLYTASTLKELKSRNIHFTVLIKGNMYGSLQIKIQVLSNLKILLKTCITVMNI